MNDTPGLIIFDLFDTLLDKVWFDYEILLDRLNDHYLNGLDRRTLSDWACNFKNDNMSDRDYTNRESSFIDQLRYYENKANIRYTQDYASIEWDLFKVCREERIGPHVADVLDHLMHRGFPMAILSNSIFSSDCLSRYLDSFGLSDYFDKVYSSADLGFRKPSPYAFLRVCNDFGVDPGDTWFIGNNREKDYLGALKAGLNAIYYNKLDESFEGDSISDLSELNRFLR